MSIRPGLQFWPVTAYFGQSKNFDISCELVNSSPKQYLNEPGLEKVKTNKILNNTNKGQFQRLYREVEFASKFKNCGTNFIEKG